MKATTLKPSRTLRTVLLSILVLVSFLLALPRPVEAQLVVKVRKQPVKMVKAPRTQVTVTGNHRAVRAKPAVTRVTVLPGAHAKSLRTAVVTRCPVRHRHDDHRVWVPGHWVRTGPRSSLWMAGRWQKV